MDDVAAGPVNKTDPSGRFGLHGGTLGWNTTQVNGNCGLGNPCSSAGGGFRNGDWYGGGSPEGSYGHFAGGAPPRSRNTQGCISGCADVAGSNGSVSATGGSSSAVDYGDVIVVTGTPTVFRSFTNFGGWGYLVTASSTSGRRAASTGRSHYYRIDSYICSTSNSKCTQDNVFTALRLVPAPTVTLSSPVQNGDGNIVIPFGPIVTYVNPGALSITNVTQPGHWLHPGEVDRQVSLSGGDIFVVTIGTGTGPLPRLNEYFAPGTWDNNAFTIQVIVSAMGG